MNALCPVGLVPDFTRHGGGLHMMPHDGWLDLHLDCDVHPVTGFRRAMNLILFIDEWDPAWGGHLEFWDYELSERIGKVLPVPNRLASFEVNDYSYHGIPTPMRAPIGTWRRTLAVYFWEPGVYNSIRPRARFVPMPGETVSAEKAEWQRKRCEEGVHVESPKTVGPAM